MSGSGYNIIETIVIPDGERSEGVGVGCDVSFSHSVTGKNYTYAKITQVANMCEYNHRLQIKSVKVDC